MELASGRKTDLFTTRRQIFGVTFSPDNRWISFGVTSAWRTFVAPFGERPIAESAWIEVVNGWDGFQWSPNGELIYTVSGRDGFRCIWAQRVHPQTRRPIGAPFAVFHAHNARLSLSNLEDSMAIGRDQMLFSMVEHTGNIWMAEWGQR